MSEPKDQPTSLNNTPDVHEHMAADAPAHHSRHGHACVVKEWWALRITAAVLVPLSVWFLVALITKLLCGTPLDIAHWLNSLPVVGAMVILLGAAFVHTRIGIHEITLDYIHGSCGRKAVNLLVDLLCLALGIGSIAAVIHLHLTA